MYESKTAFLLFLLNRKLVTLVTKTTQMAEIQRAKVEIQAKNILEFFGEDITGQPIRALFNFFSSGKLDQQRLEQSIYKTMFYSFDTDGSGTLDKNEIVELYKVLTAQIDGINEDEEIAKTLLDEIDTDGDGELSLEEFLAFMEKLHE